MLVTLVSVTMYAQVHPTKIKGSFTLPDSEKYLTLKFDFSQTVFEKKFNEEEWAVMNGKENWKEAQKEALERIVKLMNEKMTKTRIMMVLDGYEMKSSYTLYITPLELYKNGKNESVYILKNNETGEILGSANGRGYGGHFGSLGNLIGDGYENIAPSVGKLIAKHNKLKK